MFKSILRGIIIGIANIIPGVSGGTMAVSMGIYDKIIHSITHIKSEFKSSLKFLLPIFLGAGIGIVFLSFLIEFLFNKAPIQTNLFFIGLIAGGLPWILKNVNNKGFRPSYLICFILFFALVISMALLGNGTGQSVILKVGLKDSIYLFLIGMLASATMVIPGVSGSMMLMLLGYYEPIISQINAFIKSLIAFDVNAVINSIFILAPFGIGIIIGIVVIAKIIDLVFSRFKVHTYWAIIGLIFASCISIVMMNNFSNISIGILAFGVVCFVLGFIIAYKLGEK